MGVSIMAMKHRSRLERLDHGGGGGGEVVLNPPTISAVHFASGRPSWARAWAFTPI